jgi:hypothetical protein
VPPLGVEMVTDVYAYIDNVLAVAVVTGLLGKMCMGDIASTLFSIGRFDIAVRPFRTAHYSSVSSIAITTSTFFVRQLNAPLYVGGLLLTKVLFLPPPGLAIGLEVEPHSIRDG